MPHAFVSYLREDSDTVDRLVDALRKHGIEVWHDRTHLVVGDRWPHVIKTAICDGTFFIACFSPAYARRARTHMNEELTTAIEELRLRPRDRRWFLPVTIESCTVPALDLGAGETLDAVHHVDLSDDWDGAVRDLVRAITHDQEQPGLRRPPRWPSAMLIAAVAAVTLTSAILAWLMLGPTPGYLADLRTQTEPTATPHLTNPTSSSPPSAYPTGSERSNQLPSCEPHAARVNAPSAASVTFDITIDVVCPPPPGRVFWLFIRGDNIGDHGTTNYYPNFRLSPRARRQVTQNFVKPSDPDGERFYLVVSVTEPVSQTLTNKREFVNGLPPSGEIVSAPVRTVISHPSQPG